MQLEKERKKSNAYADIYMDNEIIYGVFKEDLFLDLTAAQQIVKDRKEVSNFNSMLMFVDVSSVKEVSKEARDYFGSEVGSELLKASAIYTNSKLAAFLANFLVKVNLHKSTIPIKLFTDKTKALNWLENYR